MIELQSAEGKSMLTLPLDTRVTIWLLLIDIHCKSIGYVLPIYESWSNWLCADLNTGGYVIVHQIFKKIIVTVHTNVV